jgi:2'-5' RNA ligase
MPFALEIALDADAASVVRTAWRALAVAGFPLMAESGANPHVSLAIWDEIDVPAMSAAAATFGRETRELPIVFDRIEVFATTGVVFLAPVPDSALHDMQARCLRHLDAHGRRLWPHYTRDAWVPHCTLAQDIQGPAPLARARAVAMNIPVPVAGYLSRAELVRFRPVHHLAAIPLAPSR